MAATDTKDSTKSEDVAASQTSPLPQLDMRNFVIDYPLELTVKQFLYNDPLLNAMAFVEYRCYQLAKSNSEDTPIDVMAMAKNLLAFLATVGQMYGWIRMERYIRAKTKAEEKIEKISAKGISLCKRLLARLACIIRSHIESKLAGEPQTENCLRVILSDHQWNADVKDFTKEAEVEVSAMLADNKESFNAYRDLQQKGVRWMHAPVVRKAVEAAGFTFQPMMIKRDRCVCDICRAEVSGWKVWQCPWAYHDYSRHDTAFLERALSACASNPVFMLILNEQREELRAAATMTTTDSATTMTTTDSATIRLPTITTTDPTCTQTLPTVAI